MLLCTIWKKSYPTLQQGSNSTLYSLRLAQQALLYRHCTQFASYNRLASLRYWCSSWSAGLVQRAFHPLVPIRVRLHSDGVVLEFSEDSYARIEVGCIGVEVPGCVVTCLGERGDRELRMTREMRKKHGMLTGFRTFPLSGRYVTEFQDVVSGKIC